ncbi:latent-transforming growth factor beta-binding protein 2-like [Hoplias malabaricus]|uniref:latent-transforming growth factor beta-binding protein 2-like n=1 Tax=Hoplias malabaricus TaxID=27720 RepID=UPI00346365FB
MERLCFVLLVSLSVAAAASGQLLVRPRRQLKTLVGRSRSSAKQSPPEPQESRVTQPKKLVGPHVCGGQQCCSGWAVAPGTNRCIKPDCQPPCQNRGSCSRPHTCVCRSGFQGERCEELAPEQVYIRTGTSRVLIPVKPGSEVSQRQSARRRPTERQAIDTSSRTQTPKPPVTRLPHSPVTQVRRGSPDISSQQTGSSRTVKRYPSSSGPITSNALPSSHGYTHTQHRSSSSGQPQDSHSNAVPAAGANLTTAGDRFKIIFTPTVCRRTCTGGRCYNSCERGDKTTIYSESQGPVQKNQGFRLFFCQIPCLNGGRCIGQNECWCPSNSTGKFCHLPAPTPSKATSSRRASSNGGQKGSSHSMYTLPLSNQQASMHPALVTVHVQHPPEAEVQIHQVARVKPGQTADGVHSVQQRSQPGNSHTVSTGNSNGQYTVHSSEHSHQKPHHRLNGYVGRCFQETVDGQCGKPLPGLTKQEDCCGSVGASWGLNKCTECPSKPAYAVIANGQVECPKGYKRMNSTHCQDINECRIPGICKHAECLNTKGSYRCTCKPGYMLDPARSHCVSDKAVSMEKSSCYRSLSADSCSLPLTLKITKQICCCSRVGKAWGSNCERCPLPNTDHFKEICPAGHGYTYSRSDIQITLRELEDDEISSIETYLSQIPTYPQPDQTPPEFSVHQPHIPFSTPPPYYHPQAPAQPPRTPQIPHHPHTDGQYPEHVSPSLPDPDEDLNEPIFTESPLLYPDVVEFTSQSPTQLKSESDLDAALINIATQATDIDKCSLIPTICGPGQCISVQTGYTCYCETGYKLNSLQTTCIDINECEDDPCGGKGDCINTHGSYICKCYSGYSLLMTQNRKTCQDINECAIPNKCPNGLCINTEGSFSCKCKSGFTKNPKGQCEDIDECKSPSVCPGGICLNTQGSFQCQACGPGFRPASGRCLDINECQTAGVCANGRCVNTEGSFICTCNHGYQTTPNSNRCQDVNECLHPDVCPHGKCVNLPGSHRCNCNTGYQNSLDGKACEDVDECAHLTLCVEGVCVNTVGSFTCTHCEMGYILSEDRQRCEDVNECLSLSTCPNGICLNSEGSFSCVDCPTGYRVSADGERCEDINECALPTTCPQGSCINTEGSYTCTVCGPGYRISDDGSHCEDIDECLSLDVCPRLSGCRNTKGSYSCITCDPGYRLSADRQTCEDLNECEDMAVCQNGDCINTAGSYHCDCFIGFELMDSNCRDMDECIMEGTCSNGLCQNTDGSYQCLCDSGYKFSNDSKDCEDVDECKEFSVPCGTWNCENTLGSYRCFKGCPSGFYVEENKDCDIDECEDETICGKHGYCENTDGSYRCQCDQGYTNAPDDQVCVDVNECEMSSDRCGEAQCENVEGSFLCICPSENQEFDPVTIQCSSRHTELPDSQTEQRKECYYNLNDANLCENALSQNVTKQECCCTVGAGWGDNCEIHACPVKGQEEYDWLCPHGSGILTVISSIRGIDHLMIKDADECATFGPELCKNGQCINYHGSYSCLCREGFYYDHIQMECVDYDECQERVCEHGMCVNTAGSFNCFCSPPMVLDSTQRRCISINSTDGAPDTKVHTDICWRQVKDDRMCSDPYGYSTTFTECCCLSGISWGSQCAFCPKKSSDAYAALCNLHERGTDSLREATGLEYGPDAPPEGSYVQQYWDNYGFAGGDYSISEGPLSRSFPDPSSDYISRETVQVPLQRPRVTQQPRRLDPFRDRNEGFEGLQAEECGILDGCENGRCVRVREGYTCDCFDGYELDLSKMVCTDINECKDISDSVELCKNGVCSNTEGSYNCTCLPGFMSSSKPHECIPEDQTPAPHGEGK